MSNLAHQDFARIGHANSRHGIPIANLREDEPLDQRLREELKRLATVSQDLQGTIPVGIGAGREEIGAEELAKLRADNIELHRRVQELENLLVSGAVEEAWAERQREYESLLEEKSEVIRSLHQQIQEMQGAPFASADRAQPGPAGRQETHLQMEEQRRQLEADEEAMMKQMQQMELAMSRERADLARQRAELQRLHADLNHELEQAARDPELRERLMSLQRRQQDLVNRKPGTPGQAPAIATDKSPAPPPQAPAVPQKSSGLLRRLFGS